MEEEYYAQAAGLKIINWGHDISHTVKQFCCPQCGCVWEADCRLYSTKQISANVWEASMCCPRCYRVCHVCECDVTEVIQHGQE